MNCYIEKLKEFLVEQVAGFKFTDGNSLLEMLYYYYSEENAIDNGVIHCAFRQVDMCLQKLTVQENDQVFRAVMTLCTACEKEAFLAGVRVGAGLISEVSGI